ncbi:thiamine diphosphokinase [Virgibacillus sp. DJP39]|uniref:thiamine diphosphokinase n=1 Tax=Virgibacillus sp. DJP39 TaxID=3409790 RepID=UPI003BB63EF0
MKTVGIVANGPSELIPDLTGYEDEVDIWIGADRGALTIIKFGIDPDYALGDFDSITIQEEKSIKNRSKHFTRYPVEKDQTDIEIAVEKGMEFGSELIYFFGVTGGRLDHELVNIQLLYRLKKRNYSAIIVDQLNQLEIFTPGTYRIDSNEAFPYISFVPISEHVIGMSLDGFYYPLKDFTLSLGSTRCISNKLLLNNGTFSFSEGILLLIKSRDG